MNKKHIILVLILLAIIILLTLITSTVRSNNPSAREEAIQEDQSRPEITLTVKHQYKDEEHIFVGTLDLPTPCHAFNAEVVDGETPEIKLTTQEPEADTVCTQVVTERTWKITYASDNPDLTFAASLNGEPTILNIFEVDPSEDIDTIELFIKG